jgi:photosystem II stability/assembly factor-like uncharacterized protein
MKKFLIVVFILTAKIGLTQWDVIYGPLQEGASFRGMSFVNDSTGFVSIYHEANDEFDFYVADVILQTTDYANTWDTIYYHQWICPCDPDTIYPLEDVFFLNENMGWASGQGITKVLKTIDGGQLWQQYETGVESIFQIQFVDENYGIGTSPNNQGAETFDGGETWTALQELACYQASLLDDCNKLSVDGGSISKQEDCIWSTEEFPTLNETPERNGRAIHAWNHDTYILGAMGLIGFNNFTSIMRTTDSGETYSILDWPFGSGTGPFYFLNDSVGFVCTYSSSSFYESVYKTLDSGFTWYGQATPIDSFGNFVSFSDIECLNENLSYAMNGKYIYKTVNGGGELGTMWTGIESIAIPQTDIVLFPNPVTSGLNIESTVPISKIEIFDLTGRNVFTLRPNGTQTELNSETLSNGCYFLTATLANGNTATRKFLKE